VREFYCFVRKRCKCCYEKLYGNCVTSKARFQLGILMLYQITGESDRIQSLMYSRGRFRAHRGFWVKGKGARVAKGKKVHVVYGFKRFSLTINIPTFLIDSLRCIVGTCEWLHATNSNCRLLSQW